MRPGSGVGIGMRPLFLIEKFVEMIVALVHARRRDAFGVRQFRGLEAAAYALEFAQLLVLVWRDEIAGERAVARKPPRAGPASCSGRSCGRRGAPLARKNTELPRQINSVT